MTLEKLRKAVVKAGFNAQPIDFAISELEPFADTICELKHEEQEELEQIWRLERFKIAALEAGYLGLKPDWPGFQKRRPRIDVNTLIRNYERGTRRSLPVGDKFESETYELGEEIGSGGFGTVYLVRDTWIDKKVAITVPHKQNGEFDALLRSHGEMTCMVNVHPRKPDIKPNFCQ